MTSHAGFESADTALDFIFGGNATFTLSSEKTGTHFTYKVRHKPNPANTGDSTPFFVSVLSGPDNWDNYQYIGFVPGTFSGFPTAGLVAGKKGRVDAPSFKALSWALDHLNRGTIPANLNIQHEGKCCRCARKLTRPESIEAGIGPECARQEGGMT
jgi:hypothetical protein